MAVCLFVDITCPIVHTVYVCMCVTHREAFLSLFLVIFECALLGRWIGIRPPFLFFGGLETGTCHVSKAIFS